jgi:hypothetical protein
MEKNLIHKKITHYKPQAKQHFEVVKVNFTGKENQYWRRVLNADNYDKIVIKSEGRKICLTIRSVKQQRKGSREYICLFILRREVFKHGKGYKQTVN